MLSNVGYIRGRGQQFLVAPSVFREPLTLSRAQTGGVQSSALAGDGTSLTFYAADTPRFNGSAQRLLIEGQRTNSIRNPRSEGAVPGTPGTAPTNWTRYPTPGLASSVVGFGIESNIPYVDIRFHGTATSVDQTVFRFDENYAAAALGQAWTGSVFIRLIGGTLSNVNAVYMMLPEWSAGPTFLGQNFTTINVNAGTMAASRQVFSSTLSQTATTLVGLQVSFVPSLGAIDCTFRVAAPQLEFGAFATSPILPPVGTPGASTRGSDLISATLANLGIAANGACTVLLRAMMPQLATTTGLNHSILRLDDNSLNNMFLLRNTTGANLGALRFTAGASASVTVGTLTAGTPFAVGVSIDGAGRMAVSLGGAAVVPVIGGPTSGLITFRSGVGLSADNSLFGEVERLRILPYSVSDAELQFLVGELP